MEKAKVIKLELKNNVDLILIYNFCFFADSCRFIDCDWSLWLSIRSGNSNRNFIVIVNQVTCLYTVPRLELGLVFKVNIKHR